jgi:hypothetical protein
MTAREIASAMLDGAAIPDDHDVHVDDLLPALLELVPDSGSVYIRCPSDMPGDIYIDIISMVMMSRPAVEIRYDCYSNNRKVNERMCRLMVLKRAEDDIMSDYTFTEKHGDKMPQAPYIARDIHHLVLDFNQPRERVLDWYIRYLVRADATRSAEWPKDWAMGGPSSEFGLTDDEWDLASDAYRQGCRRNAQVHLRREYHPCHDAWCEHRRVEIEYAPELEALQAEDVAREAERREMYRVLMDAGVAKDLVKIAVSYHA